MLEHIVYSQTMQHLQKHNILSEYQHRFRSGCSTETQLLKVINLFADAIEMSSQVDAIALDFSKAFDVVPHERLLLKLDYYGIRELKPWFRDFLSGRTQTVVVEGQKSREVEVTSGVPQGTVIGPLCFLIFINDLPLEVYNSFTGIFADDTLLAKQINSASDSIQLQEDLTRLEKWTETWGMKFNAGKCEVMSVTNKRSPFKNKYWLDGVCLQEKKKLKYLGLTIDNKISFSEHIEEKAKSSTTVLNMIRRNLYFAPSEVKAKAYMATVRPILEYGAVCWSPVSDKHKKTIETVQNNAAKFVRNYYPKKGHYDEYSISNVVKELGWTSLEERRNRARCTMVYKILNNELILPPDMLTRKTHTRPTRSCSTVLVGVENELKVPSNRTINSGNTFFYQAPHLWNTIVTPTQAQAVNVNIFKSQF